LKKVLFVFLVLSSLLWSETFNVSKDELCLIRKIKVYENPMWIASIKVRSGKVIYFSSPKSMFEFYYRPGKWPEYNVKSDNDMRIHVTDYNSLEKIPARDAFFVYGSTKVSPGGDDLVPFKTKEAAQKFYDENSGKRIFSFEETSAALINYLNGRYK
jgi:nitrous oxide reductase accessory protein NosL